MKVKNEKLGLGYYLFNSYGIIYDENAIEKKTILNVNEKNIEVIDYDYSQLGQGFVFDKHLSKPICFELPVVKELRTIFDGNEQNTFEQMLKVFAEYLCFFFNDVDGKTLKSPFSHFEEVSSKIKLIKVLNKEEFEVFINNLLSMNKALSSDLLEEIYHFTSSQKGNENNFTPIQVNIDKIKNKEMKLYFIEKAIFNEKFVNGYELIRFINYKLTNETLYVHKTEKDYDNSNQIYQNILETFKRNFIMNINLFEKILSCEQYKEELAKVYFTHLKTFVWLRHYLAKTEKSLDLNEEILAIVSKMKSFINKVKRLASLKSFKNNKKSFKIDYHVSILMKSEDEQKAFFEKEKLSLKELLKLYQLVQKEKFLKNGFILKNENDNSKEIKLFLKSYKIRNGNLWVKDLKEGQVKNYNDTILLQYLKQAFIDYVKIQSKKDAEVLADKFLKENQQLISKDLNYLTADQYKKVEQILKNDKIVLPLEHTSPLIFSDKNRLGTAYFGSKFKLELGDQIGIVWDLDIDYDLSYKDLNTKELYSFHSGYGNKMETKYLHSGDCRSAGSEYITLNKINDLNNEQGIFTVNVYSSEEIQKENVQIFIKRDGKFVFLSEKFSFNKNNNIIGYLKDGCFVLDFNALNESRVSGGNIFVELNPENAKILNMEKIKIELVLLQKMPVYDLETLLDKLDLPYIKKSIYQNDKNNDDFLINQLNFTIFE